MDVYTDYPSMFLMSNLHGTMYRGQNWVGFHNMAWIMCCKKQFFSSRDGIVFRDTVLNDVLKKSPTFKFTFLPRSFCRAWRWAIL
jgi:hypothetical protein